MTLSPQTINNIGNSILEAARINGGFEIFNPAEVSKAAIQSFLASDEMRGLIDGAKMGADYLDICNKMLPVKAVADVIRERLAPFTKTNGDVR